MLARRKVRIFSPDAPFKNIIDDADSIKILIICPIIDFPGDYAAIVRTMFSGERRVQLFPVFHSLRKLVSLKCDALTVFNDYDRVFRTKRHPSERKEACAQRDKNNTPNVGRRLGMYHPPRLRDGKPKRGGICREEDQSRSCDERISRHCIYRTMISSMRRQTKAPALRPQVLHVRRVWRGRVQLRCRPHFENFQ